MALMGIAFLLPRHPGLAIAAILFFAGMMCCFVGLSFLASPRHLPSLDGKGDVTPGIWLAGDSGGGHGHCGDGGGHDAGGGCGH